MKCARNVGLVRVSGSKCPLQERNRDRLQDLSGKEIGASENRADARRNRNGSEAGRKPPIKSAER
jgi:hypothetical protein